MPKSRHCVAHEQSFGLRNHETQTTTCVRLPVVSLGEASSLHHRLRPTTPSA